MKIQKKGRGAVVTFTEKDAAYLATIISYASNADVGTTGEPASQKRGRKMLFELTAMCEALDMDASTHIFALYRDHITQAERDAYTKVMQVFDPEYGKEDAEAPR